MEEKEIWMPIEGYEGLYEVSNLGRVKRLLKTCKYINNKSSTPRTEHLKYPTLNNYGYYKVTLWKNNNRAFFYLHRIIAKAFIPNPDNKPEVNHINGIKTDNNLSNLEWVTTAENLRHAKLMGLNDVRGEKNGMSKIDPEFVPIIINSVIKSSKLSKLFNVDESTIDSIRKRKTWKHIII